MNEQAKKELVSIIKNANNIVYKITGAGRYYIIRDNNLIPIILLGEGFDIFMNLYDVDTSNITKQNILNNLLGTKDIILMEI